jgi:hypothetical protein
MKMGKDEVLRSLNGISFDALGDVIWRELDAFDNSPTDMAKYVTVCLEQCETEGEFKAANTMLTALTGWRIETLVRMAREAEELEVNE